MGIDIDISKCDKNINKILIEGESFKVVRSNPYHSNHITVLQNLDNLDRYGLIHVPHGIIGDLYSIIVVSNESKYAESKYLDIADINKIVSEFISKNQDINFELNIGLSLSLLIKSDNVNYYGKTYKESDYIYEFPGDMHMCMVYNNCEPNKIYIMVGGLDKDDN